MQDLLARMHDKYDLYTKIGFFRDIPFEALKQQFMRLHGNETEFRWFWLDVLMLKFNESQVWCGDPECNVDSVNAVYETILSQWSAVSDGLFEPTNIGETWQDWNGPIQVTFDLNGHQCAVRPNYMDDYLDLLIIKQINSFLKSDRLFYCFSDSNFALVFTLTPSQHKAFMDLKFPFAW
jgi:hypothetical protein